MQGCPIHPPEGGSALVDGTALVPAAGLSRTRRRFDLFVCNHVTVSIRIAGGCRQGSPGTAFKLAARPADASNATDPFPDAGDVAAAAFANGSAHISIALDDAADPAPQLFAPLALEFKPQDVIAELADRNVGLSSAAAGIQRGLGSQPIKCCSYEFRNASDIRAARENTSARIGQSASAES